LHRYQIPGTVFLIAETLGQYNSWDVNLGGIKYKHLNDREIRELLQNGWEIGSHGLTHRLLVGMQTEILKSEIEYSKQIIEDRFSTPVRYFCAPFGKLNRKIIEIAKEAGYQGICGFYPFKYYTQKPPGYLMLRLAVYSFDSLRSIERKLAANWQIRVEITKQNVVNFCSNGTIIVQKLK